MYTKIGLEFWGSGKDFVLQSRLYVIQFYHMFMIKIVILDTGMKNSEELLTKVLFTTELSYNIFE